MKTLPATKTIKAASVRALVQKQLKEIKFYPVPSEVLDGIINKVQNRIHSVVKDVVSWNTIATVTKECKSPKHPATMNEAPPVGHTK